MPIERICPTCGKHFFVNPYRVKINQGIFCSIKCIKKQPPKKIIKKCALCGKTFYVWPSQDRLKFCSLDCAYIHRRGKNHPAWKEKKYINCQTCGKQFEVNPSRFENGNVKFCSKKCYNESLKLRVGENHPNWKGGEVIRHCKVCGREFKIKPSLIKNGFGKFCSRSCASKNRIGVKNSNWKGGSSFEPYCSKFNEQLKERIRDRDNRTCQLCGMKEGGHKLDCHHIHHDKENCYPDLISLCHQCHSKVNGDRDYYETLFMNMLNDKEQLMWKY